MLSESTPNPSSEINSSSSPWDDLTNIPFKAENKAEISDQTSATLQMTLIPRELYEPA